MKRLTGRLITVLFVIYLSFSMVGITPNQLASLTPSYCDKFNVKSAANLKLVNMDFNSAEILNKGMCRLLNERGIIKITLYYSIFKYSEKFNQPLLNLERFKNLFKLMPSLAGNDLIEWEVIGQTDGFNSEKARELFHGFAIEVLPVPDLESISLEKSYLEEVISSDSLGRDSSYYIEKYRVRSRKRWSGYYLPKSKRKLDAGIVYRKKSVWGRNRQYLVVRDSSKIKTKVTCFIPNPHATKFIYRNAIDTTVFSVFRRNEFWSNMVFIVDVTGSMSPYTSQLLVWYKLNTQKRVVKNFTFFNDGNNKKTSQKQIGKTGGLLYTDATKPEQMAQAATNCMLKGFGGDSPENNCEAILLAQAMNPTARELFMIADNWANMRDTVLIKDIKKPVHIILCGVVGDLVNTQYLDLARRTKGSLHTLEHDIENLMTISEGEMVAIGGTNYRIQKGRFELVR